MTPAQSLASSLAPLLPGWAVSGARYEGDEHGYLARQDGARVVVDVGGWRMAGRVEFRGCWPEFQDKTLYSGGKRAAITCDASRSPEALAKGLCRRLLPVYLPEYEKALAYVLEHDGRAREALAVATRLADAIGATVGENKSRRGDGVSIRGTPEGVNRLVVQPAYGDGNDAWSRPVSVNFELHGVDPETAAQVLALLREKDDSLASVARRFYEENAAVEELEEVEEETVVARLRVR